MVRTALRMTLPKDDPLVGVVRTGSTGGDPRAFARAVFGAYLDDASSITWGRATVRLDSGATTAEVEVANTESVSTARYRRAYLRRPTTVEVDLHTARLGFVNRLGDTTVQSPTSLRGAVWSEGTLRITFAPPGATDQLGPGDPRPAPVAAGWKAITNLVWPRALAVLPWLVLVFCLGWCSRRTRRWSARSCSAASTT